MIYPDSARLNAEFTHNAAETRQEGYMLEMSVNRAAALLDAAYLYETTNGKAPHCIPNGRFSDAECTLWELFLQALRTNVR